MGGFPVIPDLDDDQQKLGRRGQQGVIAAPTDGPQPASGPAPVVPKITPQLGQRRASDEARLKQATDQGSGISQLPTAARIPLRVLEGIGGAILPKVTSRIPGTEMHHEAELGQLRSNLGQDVAQLGVESRAGAEQAGAAKEAEEIPTIKPKAEAEIKHTNAETNAIENPQPKPKEEEWSVVQNMSGPNGEPVQQEKTSGQIRLAPISGVQAKPQKPDTPEQQFIDEYQRIHKGATVAQAVAAYAAATQKPERDQRQLAVIDGKVVELKPGMEVPQGTMALNKDIAGPNADEQKRADLTENLNENLTQLEDIVTRRPELFGKVAGRVTKVREFLGSDDKDVAALKGIEDRLGMVSQSAHGMRSAHHVAQSADSILNGFKNGPDAVKHAISEARRSAATFTHDVQRKTNAAQPQQAPSAGNDPLGIR